MQAIAEAENIEVNEEEMDEEIADLAEQYNMEESRVRDVLSPDLLQNDISLKKAIDLITSTAKETEEATASQESEADKEAEEAE